MNVSRRIAEILENNEFEIRGANGFGHNYECVESDNEEYIGYTPLDIFFIRFLDGYGYEVNVESYDHSGNTEYTYRMNEQLMDLVKDDPLLTDIHDLDAETYCVIAVDTEDGQLDSIDYLNESDYQNWIADQEKSKRYYQNVDMWDDSHYDLTNMEIKKLENLEECGIYQDEIYDVIDGLYSNSYDIEYPVERKDLAAQVINELSDLCDRISLLSDGVIYSYLTGVIEERTGNLSWELLCDEFEITDIDIETLNVDCVISAMGVENFAYYAIQDMMGSGLGLNDFWNNQLFSQKQIFI